MTPKEKAIDLVDRYYWTFGDGYLGEQHIQCALIAVDELMKSTLPSSDFGGHISINATEYWQEVKQEIENL